MGIDRRHQIQDHRIVLDDQPSRQPLHGVEGGGVQVGNKAGFPVEERIVALILPTESIFALKQSTCEPGIGASIWSRAHLYQPGNRNQRVLCESLDYTGVLRGVLKVISGGLRQEAPPLKPGGWILERPRQ